MCGIIGYIGKEKPISSIIELLKKIEYRGYDSAGIGFISNNEIKTYKSIGNINNLKKSCNLTASSTCILAHTRWATHGEVSIKNTHPQLSNDNKWAVVHNGIIENYLEIKNNFLPKTIFNSDTDTCVVSELLSQHKVSNIQEFINCIKLLKGSFALCCINKNNKDEIYIAKNKSPLYCSITSNGVFIASDPICFSQEGLTYYSLNDNEFGIASNNGIQFYNKNGEKIDKKQIKLNLKLEETNLKQEHFMLKEILEEKQSLKNLLNNYIKNKKILNQTEKIQPFNSIEIVGCGTAYHSGLIGAKYFESILKKPAKCSLSSEFIYSNTLIDKNTLYIFISQSGETADTISALKKVKNKHCQTIVITNVEYSTIAKMSKVVLPVCAGQEIAVASTKSYINQLAVLYILANKLKSSNKNYFSNLKKIINQLSVFDLENIDKVCNLIYNNNNITLIGKNYDYITAQETSLKIKETCYLNTNAYPSGELKHGYIALIEKNTPLIVFLTDEMTKVKTKISSAEAKSRGAIIINVCTENTDELTIKIPKAKEPLLQPLLTMQAMQYLAYSISIKNNINPDQPRNLAKSVTVE